MYKKLTPSISYVKKDPDLKSNKYTSLRFKYYFIDRPDNNQSEKINNIYSFNLTKGNPGGKKTKFINYNNQYNSDFIKNSITFYYRNYFSDYRQFSLRVFGGKFLKNNITGNWPRYLNKKLPCFSNEFSNDITLILLQIY